MEELTETFREDLLRFMTEYRWEPRITTKLLNLRHGTSYTAADIIRFYGQLRPKEPDPVEHLLNLENRRSPILPDDEGWIWNDPSIYY